MGVISLHKPTIVTVLVCEEHQAVQLFPKMLVY